MTAEGDKIVHVGSDFAADTPPSFLINSNGLVRSTKAEVQKGIFKAQKGEIQTKVTNSEGIETDIIAQITSSAQDENKYVISIPKQNEFKSGKYTLSIILKDQGKTQTLTQDFTWGVLAINFDKSSYKTNEKVNIGLAVLDQEGKTLCDAKNTISIYGPGGEKTTLSNEQIKVSVQCANKSITDLPDYTAEFIPKTEGKYSLEFTAETLNGTRIIHDSFDVLDDPLFVIKRSGSMRIYPVSDYRMSMLVYSKEGFTGDIREVAPDNFVIKDISDQGRTQLKEGKIEISWNLEILAGEEKEISYVYKAPVISPEFYLLGPAKMFQETIIPDSLTGEVLVKEVFSEPRSWQIASDAPNQPTFKAAGTFTPGTGAITPPYPINGSAPVEGDVALLVVSSENEAISLTTADGFTELGAQANKAAGTAATNPGSRLAVYWKRCVGGDSNPVVADSGNNTEGQIFLFSGVRRTGDPWNIYAEGNDSGASDTTGVIPGATTTVANTLVVAISSTSNNGTSTAQFTNVGSAGGWTNADLASLTEQADASNTAGLGGGFGMVTGTKATTGTYASTTVTLASTSYKGAMSIALAGSEPPTLSISQPDGTSDTIAEGGSYSVTYTLADTDDVVTSAFYYDTDATGLNGTAIAGACATAAEGTGVTCSWDTTGVSPGSYYIYGITSDGINSVSTYSSGVMTINAKPTISISQPDGVSDTVTSGDSYNVTYTLADTDDIVTSAFYYDTDATGLNGTAITGACATAAEGTGVTCSWNTTGMSAGSYYVYGVTTDGTNSSQNAYSSGTITILAPPITVSGYVYSNETPTAYDCSGNNLTIKTSTAGGTSQTADCTLNTGAYSITTAVAPTQAGDPVTVFIDSAESVKGTSITLAADTISNITLNIYIDRVYLTHNDSGPMTNAKLATADNTDVGIRYSVATSNLTTESGMELHVAGSKTYTPGGNVTTNNTSGGDLHLDTSSAFNPEANTISIGGSYTNSGTMTASTSLFTFSSTSTGKTLSGTMTGTSKFNNLTFNNAAGAWTFGANAAEVADNFTITASETATSGVTLPSTTLTVTGNYANTAGRVTHNSGTVLMNAGDTGNTLTGTMTGNSKFYNLEFNNAAGAWSFGANDAETANNFTITASETTTSGVTLPSTTLTITGNYANTAGRVTHNSGSVLMNAGDTGNTLSGTIIGTSSLYNITFDNAAGSWSLANNFAVINDFTITASETVTLGVRVFFLTIGGNYANNGGWFNHFAGGGVAMNAGDTGNTLSGTMTGNSKFYNLAFNNNAGAWSFGANAVEIANDFDCYYSETAVSGVTAPSTTLTISGNFLSQSCIFTHNSGTVIMDAADTGNTLSGYMTGNSKFYNLEFNNAAGAWSFGANSAVVANNFTITASETTTSGVTLPSTTLTITGNYANTAGRVTHNSGIVLMNAGDTGNTLTGTMTGNSKFYNLTFNNAAGAWSFGANDAETANNFTITASETTTSGVILPSTTLTVTGNYANTVGRVTHNSGTVTFNSTSTGKTLSGNMNDTGSNSFYKLKFDGVGGGWTINDPIKVSAANATDTLLVNNGTVTLGNGSGDNLEVAGKTVIAGTADQTATLQTAAVSEGSTITMDINPGAATCANCLVSVGATSGTGQGNLKLAKNTILKLRPGTASDTGVEVESTGYFEVLGSQDDTGTSNGTTDETTLTASAESYGIDAHNGKTLRMTSGLAIGKLYPITDTTATTLTRADTSSSDATMTVTGTGPTRKICSNSTTLITASLQEVGRYIHDKTGTTGYLQIASSTNNDATCSGSTDSFTVIASPGAFSILTDTDTFDISDAILSNDQYEILDYAHVTAENGVACDAAINSSYESYVYAKAGSQTNIQYGDVCNLGRNMANKYGLTFDTVNGANSNDGVSVDKSQISNSYAGLHLLASTNNTLSYNALYGMSNNGITLQLSKNNNLISNSSYRNATGFHIYDSSTSNVISSNKVHGNVSHGIYIDTNSSDNTIISNQSFGNPNGIRIDDYSANNLISSNTLYGNSDGFYLRAQAYNVFISNSSYSNTRGLYVYGSNPSTGDFIENDFGGQGQNISGDITFLSSDDHQFSLYNTTLASTTEVSGVTTAGAYIISRNHDGVAGSTKVWGEYTAPTDIANTPQLESTEKYNYANNTWEKSATPHGYYGTGTEDTNLSIDISTATLSGGPYSYRAVAQAGGTASCATATVFDVYRNNTDTGLDATCGTEFTDTSGSVNVKFTIQGGAVAYVLGDTYTFTVFDASGDAGTTSKALTIMQDGDFYTTPSGTTLELKGQSAGTNETLVTRGATGGYHMNVAGTIDAQYYKFSYLGGTGGGLGLDLQSTATVTNLANGTYDNYQNVGATDTYLRVHSDLIGTGSPTKTFANLTFVEASDGVPEYTVTESGGALTPGQGYWLFDTTATCTGWTTCEASDLDSSDGGVDTNGYIHFTYVAPPITVSGYVYSNETPTAYDCSANNLTIKTATNGGASQTADCTLNTGAYSITTAVAPTAAGQPVTVFIDSAESVKGTSITLAADTTSNITLNIYIDRVYLTHNDSGPMTNAKLATADNTDAGIRYAVATSNLTTESGMELHVAGSKTYTPGGTVSTQGAGSFHMDDSSTSTLANATNSIAGDINVDTGATLNLNADTSVSGGDLTTAGTATITTSGTPTVTITGSGNIGGGSNAIPFYNLTLGDGAYTTTAASDFTVLNQFKIDGTTQARTLDASSKTITLAGSGADTSRPFYINGSGNLTPSTSTIIYTGTSATEIQAETYNNLHFKPTSGSPTYQLCNTTGQTIATNNQFTVGNGTNAVTVQAMVAHNPTINIGGTLTVDSSATFSGNSEGTITVNGHVMGGGTINFYASGEASLTRSSSGLLIRDDFNSDTSSNYTQGGGSAGDWTISSGQAHYGRTDTTSSRWRQTLASTPQLVTVRAKHKTAISGADSAFGLGPDVNSAFNDGATFRWNNTTSRWELYDWNLLKVSYNTTTPADEEWWYLRVLFDGTNMQARGGTSTLTTFQMQSAFGLASDGASFLYSKKQADFDWLEARTSHQITVTDLPAGYYVRVSDGTTTAKAQESGGTSVVDAGAVLFPLASVSIYNGDPDGAGTLVTSIDTGDYSDMGGGDTYSYSGVSTGGTFDHRISTNVDFGSTSGTNDWTFNNLTMSTSNPSNLIRLSSGLLAYDDFSSDTSADYAIGPPAGSMTIASGVVTFSSTNTLHIRADKPGAKCVTVRSKNVTGDRAAGSFINANSSISANADIDGYDNLMYFGSIIAHKKTDFADIAETSNATDVATIGNWELMRLYITASNVISNHGTTTLGTSQTLTDTTYSSGYGGVYAGGETGLQADWLDIRTSHQITVTNLPTGYYARVSDGTTTAKAAESSGTAIVDAGAVLFPLASVNIYNGDPDAGGSLVTSIDTGDYADMGGGDTFDYSGMITTSSGGTGKIITNGTLQVGKGTDTYTTTVDNNTNDRIIDANSDFGIASKGSYSASSSTAFNVGGSYLNYGTFTANGGTTTLDAADTGNTLSGTMTGTSAFGGLTFDNASGGWTVNTELSTTGTMSLTAGSLTQGANFDLLFLGNVALAEGTTFTKASGTGKFKMDGDNDNETFTDSHATKVDLGSVIIGQSPGTTSLSSDMSATNLTINSGDTLNTRGYEVTLTDYLTNSGTLTLTDGGGGEGDGTVVTLGGNWTSNTGSTFTPSTTSTVVFNDSGKTSTVTYTANTSFYNMTISTAGKQMKFDSSESTTVTGTLTIQGTNCTTGRVFLDPETDNNDWAIVTTGATLNIDYADIEDSTATGSPTADNSTKDNAGNTGWTINAGTCAAPITVSGYVYSSETPTAYDCSGNNLTIKTATAGGTSQSGTCTLKF